MKIKNNKEIIFLIILVFMAGSSYASKMEFLDLDKNDCSLYLHKKNGKTKVFQGGKLGKSCDVHISEKEFSEMYAFCSISSVVRPVSKEGQWGCSFGPREYGGKDYYFTALNANCSLVCLTK